MSGGAVPPASREPVRMRPKEAAPGEHYWTVDKRELTTLGIPNIIRSLFSQPPRARPIPIRPAVNRLVAGSNPARGAKYIKHLGLPL
jgi:hypothetical protein